MEVTQNTTYEVNDWPIFQAGTWNGNTYSEKDLDSIVESFDAIGGKVKPYLKLGHDDAQKLVQEDGLPAAGWITQLRRDGNTLLANIRNIPQKIYQLMMNKAYGRVSSEIYHGLTEDGKKYPRVLKAVSLLGGDTPAVWTLDDFIDLYTNTEYDEIINYEFTREDKSNESEANIMDEIEKLKAEFSAQLDALRAELDAKNTELEKYKSQIAEAEAEKEAQYAREIEDTIDAAVKEKKITPAQKAVLFALAKGKSAEVKKFEFIENNAPQSVEGNGLELVKQFINLQSSIDFSEQSKHVEISMSERSDDDKLVEAIDKFRKENPSLSYADAFSMAAKEIKGA